MEDACWHEITAMFLNATTMGKPLYETCGFVSMSMEGELPFSS